VKNEKTGLVISVGLVSLILLTLGVLLIASSYLPLRSLTTSQWTIEDSQRFSRVTRELHDATIEARGPSMRNPVEIEKYETNLKKEFERLSSKLEHAQQEPQRWSRILLWSGAALAGVGVVMHLAQRKE
jgi:hypothetical protein